MKNPLQLLILSAIASVECGLPRRVESPEIQIIPTGIIPQICVTASRELPPCGIGKFKKNQHDYEEKIGRIRQSYVDMVIDFKNTKDVSFENFGPSRVYLESFESLERRMQEEEESKLVELEEAIASEMKIPTIKTKPTIDFVRVVRSLTTTVIRATECIPLGVEFCDDFPRPAADETEISKIQKRSLPAIPEFFEQFWNSESKGNGQHKSSSVTDGLVEIIPQNREDFFKRVDKRSILGDSSRVDNEKVNRERLYGGLYEVISPRNFQFSEAKKNIQESFEPEAGISSLDFITVHKKLELYDMLAFIEKRFGVKKYEEEEQLEN